MTLEERLRADLVQAETKAWDSLARYKFFMFGYHAADVVKLRRLLRLRGNPFKALVDLARAERGTVDAESLVLSAHQATQQSRRSPQETE